MRAKNLDVTFLYINKEHITSCKGKLTDFVLIILLDCLCLAKLYFLLWVLVWAKFIFFTIPDKNHVKIHYYLFSCLRSDFQGDLPKPGESDNLMIQKNGV
jgi:hypothetical protein